MEIRTIPLSNRKGIFFTTLVIIMLTILVVTFTFYSGTRDRETIERRIETMNSFLLSIDEDIQRKLFISGFRTIFLAQKHMLETGIYLNSSEGVLQEAFFDGKINGVTNSEIEQLMNGVTFPDIVNLTNERANSINVNVTFTNASLRVTQDDPWNIRFTFFSGLEVKDLSGLASWNRSQIVIAYLPIEGFEDPIYPLEKNDLTVKNTIKKTPYFPFSSSNDLINHANKTFYLNHSKAPSFLDRLEGNLSGNNSNGIESLAVPKLISFPGRSIVDYKYFTNQPGNLIPGLPDYYYIDTEHQDFYSVP